MSDGQWGPAPPMHSSQRRFVGAGSERYTRVRTIWCSLRSLPHHTPTDSTTPHQPIMPRRRRLAPPLALPVLLAAAAVVGGRPLEQEGAWGWARGIECRSSSRRRTGVWGGCMDGFDWVSWRGLSSCISLSHTTTPPAGFLLPALPSSPRRPPLSRRHPQRRFFPPPPRLSIMPSPEGGGAPADGNGGGTLEALVPEEFHLAANLGRGADKGGTPIDR